MKNKKAFTLAETLIVLVILGIIASITIPAVIRNQMEAQNRTRIRKAMTVYDTAINKMVVENGIKSNDALINEFNAENNNGSCAKSRAYFKVAQDGVDDCTFRASDGVWWNISDINHPIIAFNDDDLDGEINIPKSFGLYAWFDKNGSLRIDDLKAIENYEQASETDKINLSNLYKYLAGEKITAESTLPIIGPYVSCDQYENCSAYDENGRQVGNICNESGTSCYVYYTYTQNGDKIIKTTGDDCTGSDIGSCPYKQYTTLDKKGREIGGGCDESGTSCSVYLTYIQKGDKTIKIQGSGSGCSESDISSCPNKSYSTLDEKGRQTGTGCNDSGTNCWAYSTYTKNGDKTIKTYGEQCTGSDISSCPNKRYSTFDEKGRMTGDYCNETGTECEATYTITEQ